MNIIRFWKRLKSDRIRWAQKTISLVLSAILVLVCVREGVTIDKIPQVKVNNVSYINPVKNYSNKEGGNEVKPGGIFDGDGEEYYKLTSDKNSAYGYITYEHSNINDDDYENFMLEGEFLTGWGTDTGADAFYVYLFPSTQDVTSEDDKQSQYSINFDEYQDEIQLKYNGEMLAKRENITNIDDEQPHTFAIWFFKGQFFISMDGHDRTSLFYDDSANYKSRMGNSDYFGFGARTGSQNNKHFVKNMKITFYKAPQIELVSPTPYENFVHVGVNREITFQAQGAESYYWSGSVEDNELDTRKEGYQQSYNFTETGQYQILIQGSTDLARSDILRIYVKAWNPPKVKFEEAVLANDRGEAYKDNSGTVHIAKGERNVEFHIKASSPDGLQISKYKLICERR